MPNHPLDPNRWGALRNLRARATYSCTICSWRQDPHAFAHWPMTSQIEALAANRGHALIYLWFGSVLTEFSMCETEVHQVDVQSQRTMFHRFWQFELRF